MKTKVLQTSSNSTYTKEVTKIKKKNNDIWIRKNYDFNYIIADDIHYKMKFFKTYFAPYKFDYEFVDTSLEINCDFVIDTVPVRYTIDNFFKLYKDLLTNVNMVDVSYHFCFDDGKPANIFYVKNKLLAIDESKLRFSTDKEYIKLKAIEAGIKYITSIGYWTKFNTPDYIVNKLMQIMNEVYE
jgi:hypothetical protein